ncbi:hypothetical protein MBLNU230_g7020t1 [Neophaeotheca triangularis]
MSWIVPYGNSQQRIRSLGLDAIKREIDVLEYQSDEQVRMLSHSLIAPQPPGAGMPQSSVFSLDSNLPDPFFLQASISEPDTVCQSWQQPWSAHGSQQHAIGFSAATSSTTGEQQSEERYSTGTNCFSFATSGSGHGLFGAPLDPLLDVDPAATTAFTGSFNDSLPHEPDNWQDGNYVLAESDVPDGWAGAWDFQQAAMTQAYRNTTFSLPSTGPSSRETTFNERFNGGALDPQAQPFAPAVVEHRLMGTRAPNVDIGASVERSNLHRRQPSRPKLPESDDEFVL